MGWAERLEEREQVERDIWATCAPDEEPLWVGCSAYRMYLRKGLAVRVEPWAVGVFLAGGVAVATWVDGSVAMSVGCALLSLAFAIAMVRAGRRQRRRGQTMVYAITSQRVIGLSADGFGFDFDAAGLVLTCAPAWGSRVPLTNVSFVPPRRLPLNGSRLNFSSGYGFVGVQDRAGMLRAFALAGAADPVWVRA